MNIPRPPATLIVKMGPQRGIFFPLTDNRMVIGREETCNIIVQDAEASRRHCELGWEEGAYIVQDLGSTNGTFVNGSQITVPTRLKQGDSIGVGQTTLVLQFETDSSGMQAGFEAPAQPRPAKAAKSDAPEAAPGKRRKWLLIGCGCLVLLCVCGAVALVGLDLLDYVDLGIPGLSNLSLGL
ncbi:MAG: FHA domain-containing protein [Anaerolineae bacterium]